MEKDEGEREREGGRQGGRERRKVLQCGNKESLCRATLGRQKPSIMGHVFWCCANDMVSRTSSMPPLSRTPTLPPFHLPISPIPEILSPKLGDTKIRIIIFNLD